MRVVVGGKTSTRIRHGSFQRGKEKRLRERVREGEEPQYPRSSKARGRRGSM